MCNYTIHSKTSKEQTLLGQGSSPLLIGRPYLGGRLASHTPQSWGRFQCKGVRHRRISDLKQTLSESLWPNKIYKIKEQTDSEKQISEICSYCHDFHLWFWCPSSFGGNFIQATILWGHIHCPLSGVERCTCPLLGGSKCTISMGRAFGGTWKLSTVQRLSTFRRVYY